MPSVPEDPANPTNLGEATPFEDSLVARLNAMEGELEDVLEQKRVALGRHMRGAERDNLRRRFERSEALVRQRIEAIRSSIQEN